MPDEFNASATRSDSAVGRPPVAYRILFTYEGLNVKMGAAQRLEMMSPPSDPIPGQVGVNGLVEPLEQTGFWYELRDANERPLYRRVIDNPIKLSVSDLSGDPEHPFTNRMITNPRGDFLLIIPAIDTAANLVLFSSAERDGYPDPAQEIARFDYKLIQAGGNR